MNWTSVAWTHGLGIKSSHELFMRSSWYNRIWSWSIGIIVLLKEKSAVEMASTAASHSSFHVGLPGPCEHKADIGCMLSALPCCCSCADRRQHAAAYPTYVDGEGMIMKGRRWQRYCRRCHGKVYISVSLCSIDLDCFLSWRLSTNLWNLFYINFSAY